MRTIVVKIEGRPPTPNARPGNWQVARRMTDKWKLASRIAAQDAMIHANRLLPSDEARPWPLEVEREGIPAGGRRRKPVPMLCVCANPIGYAVRYEMVFVVGTRVERDWDNAVASSKPLTDGMVECGLLAGDSTSYIASSGRRVSFLYRKGENGVEITIEEGDRPEGQLPLLTE